MLFASPEPGSPTRESATGLPEAGERSSPGGRFRLESLEQRLMFSATLCEPPALIAIDEKREAVVEVEWNETAAAELNGGDEASGARSPDLYAVDEVSVDFSRAEPGADGPEASLLVPTGRGETKGRLWEESEDREQVLEESGASSVTEWLVTTLRAPNGPPETAAPLPDLPGMHPATPVPQAGGQVFFLDFDGAVDVHYNGPEGLLVLDVAPLAAPAGLDAREIAAGVLSGLADLFAGSGVTFRADLPTAAGEWSTIYVGGTDEAFRIFGAFNGLAEQVDAGNVNRSDEALVFSANLLNPGMTREEAIAALTAVIAEEAGHLLGYEDAHPARGALYRVADGDNTILSISEAGVATGGELMTALTITVGAPGVYTLTIDLEDATAWTVGGDSLATLDDLTTNGAISRIGSFHTWEVALNIPAAGVWVVGLDSLIAPSTEGADSVTFRLYAGELDTAGYSPASPPAPEDSLTQTIAAYDRMTYSAGGATGDGFDPKQRIVGFWDFVSCSFLFAGGSIDGVVFPGLFDLTVDALGVEDDSVSFALASIDIANRLATIEQQIGIVAGVEELLNGMLPTTELELALALSTQLRGGIAVPGLGITLKAAELAGGYKLSWTPKLSELTPLNFLSPGFDLGTFKISRGLELSFTGGAFTGEQYVELTGLNSDNLCSGILDGSEQITVGMSLQVGLADVNLEGEVGEFLNFKVQGEAKLEGTLKFQTTITVDEFLELYGTPTLTGLESVDAVLFGPDAFASLPRAARLTFALTDLFVPGLGDAVWSSVIPYGSMFRIPIDVALGNNNSFLPIIINAPNTHFRAEVAPKGILRLEGDAKLEATFGFGDADLGFKIDLGVAVSQPITAVDTSAPYFGFLPAVELLKGPTELGNILSRIYGIFIDDDSDLGHWTPGVLSLVSVETIAADLAPHLSKIGGVTVVTHGFQPWNGEDTVFGYWQGEVEDLDGDGDLDPLTGRGASAGDSLRPIAAKIHNLAPGWLLDYDIADQGEPGMFDAEQSVFFDSSIAAGAPDGSLEVVLLFDWAPESNEVSPGWGEAAGDALFSLLVRLGLLQPEAGAGNPFAYHFIAHSFGTAVTSEAIERLAAWNVSVDHVTYLDPHDFDQAYLIYPGDVPIYKDDALPDLIEQNLPDYVAIGDIVPHDGYQELYTLGQAQGLAPHGYGATVWNNVRFADAYFQTYAFPEGRPIPGAHNIDLTDILTGNIGAHSRVWDATYADTITRDAAPGYGWAAWSRLGVRGPYLDNDGDGLIGEEEVELQDEVTEGLLEDNRPLPQFYADDGDAVHGRELDGDSHEHSSPNLVGILSGDPNAGGLQALGLDRDDITGARWHPLVSPFTVINGGFTGYGSANDLIVGDDNIVPGWSHHGGGGAGVVTSALGSASVFLPLSQTIGDITDFYLQLTKEALSRTHNFLYIPTTAGAVSFNVQRDGGFGNDDVLKVFLGPTDNPASLIGSFPLKDISSGGEEQVAFIPGHLRGTARQLSFVIQTETEDSALLLDDVSLVPAVRTGDVVRIDLRHLENLAPLNGGDPGFEIRSVALEDESGLTITLTVLTPSSPVTDTGIGSITFSDAASGARLALIFDDLLSATAFSTSGVLLFAPPVQDALPGDVDEEARGFQGFVRITYAVTALGAEDRSIAIPVFSGHTVTKDTDGLSDAQAVASTGPNTDHERAARVQQRLSYLGFRSTDGSALLPVNGLMDGNTTHAIGVWTAAALSSGDTVFEAIPSSDIRYHINRAGNPTWELLTEFDFNHIAVDPLADETYVTSWAVDVLLSWDLILGAGDHLALVAGSPAGGGNPDPFLHAGETPGYHDGGRHLDFGVLPDAVGEPGDPTAPFMEIYASGIL